MEYILNNNDYKVLDEITKISYDIISLYRDLICIESTGYTNNSEYKYLYNSLLNNIKKEDNLYKSLYNSPYKSRSMCKYIVNMFDFDDEEADTYIDNDLVFLRIFRTLCDCFLLTKDYIDDNLQLFFKSAGMECNLDDLSSNDKIGLMYYLKYFKEDFDFSYIYFLDEFLKINNKYLEINNILINEKYQKIIENKSLERRILIDRENSININSRFVYDMNVCNKNICNSVSYIYCNFFAINSISNLLDIKDCDYKDFQNLALGIMNQSIMRSCLLFMDDDNIMDANDSYHEHVDNNKDMNKDNSNSQKLIINGFRKVKKDKLKRRIISLNHN